MLHLDLDFCRGFANFTSARARELLSNNGRSCNVADQVPVRLSQVQIHLNNFPATVLLFFKCFLIKVNKFRVYVWIYYKIKMAALQMVPA